MSVYHPDPEINAGVAADALDAELADLAAGYPPSRWRCECGAEHQRGFFQSAGTHRCLACGYVGSGGVMLVPGEHDVDPEESRPVNTTPEPGLFKVIETDGMTGWQQYLNNMSTDPWSGTFTREQAEASVEWREKNITRRYSYQIVPVQPHMTDNGEARKRHQDRHGSHRMEDCSEVDCREAATRLARGD